MNFAIFASLVIALGMLPGRVSSYTPCAGCPYSPPYWTTSTTSTTVPSIVSTTTTTTTSTSVQPSCIPQCPPPTATFTVTQLVSATFTCPPLTYSTQTVTCSDFVSTVSRTISLYIDCPVPTTATVSYIRCPSVTTISRIWETRPACTDPAPVTICPKATSTSTATAFQTLGGPCKTSTVTLPPATQTIPNCPPTPTIVRANLWGQCGGIGWVGPTVCVEGAVCKVWNPYHSQCLAP
jgi:hypothetical protein